ncbi:hypothetical protein ACIA58_13545 [Kribbella sp. NPDC051586]|uniref:hypothetical protein n=1 Tax=Kribbella sp. NPDC051586 TaxID=3364118 RepID=UPI0037AA938E
MITDAQLTHFREQGYVVVPGVLSDTQLATGRRIVATMLERKPPQGVGPHFLSPRLHETHPLLELYRAAGIAGLAGELVRPELAPQEPNQVQVVTTVPPWPHVPGGPHVDGITPTLDDGTPGTFTVLAELWLTDHDEPDRGNLYVWPGTHLRFGAYLAEPAGGSPRHHNRQFRGTVRVEGLRWLECDGLGIRSAGASRRAQEGTDLQHSPRACLRHVSTSAPRGEGGAGGDSEWWRSAWVMR